MAAPLAERVTFSVGAIPERVAWAFDTARAARRKQELGDHGISYGVQIIVVCHPDIESVREAATSFVAPLARFQVIQSAAEKLSGATLSWEFVRRFAVVGPVDHCIERLLELVELGIERFVIVGPGFHAEASANGRALFATEVMPAVRAATARHD